MTGRRGWAALGLALMTTGMLAAQPPGGGDKGGGRGFGGGRGMGMGGGSMMTMRMLEDANVQKELKFTDDDKAGIPLLKEEVQKLTEKTREAMQDLDRSEWRTKGRELRETETKEVQKLITDAYGEERSKRLRQIGYQMMPISALLSQFGPAEIRKELEITEDQSTKIGELQQESMRAAFAGGGGFRPMPGGEPPSEEQMKEMRTKMEAAQKELSDKIMKDVLTDAQKKKLDGLLGAKVDFKIEMQGPLGGGRGQRGGRADKGGEKGADKAPPGNRANRTRGGKGKGKQGNPPPMVA